MSIVNHTFIQHLHFIYINNSLILIKILIVGFIFYSNFITINQQVTQIGPFGQAVTTTLNDITQGDFDIIVADTQASASQRQAQMYSLIDAVKTLGVPGDAVFDLILDLSDIHNK